MDPISLLVNILVVVVLVALLWWVLSLVTLPGNAKNIVLVVFVVLCVLWLLRGFWGATVIVR